MRTAQHPLSVCRPLENDFQHSTSMPERHTMQAGTGILGTLPPGLFLHMRTGNGGGERTTVPISCAQTKLSIPAQELEAYLSVAKAEHRRALTREKPAKEAGLCCPCSDSRTWKGLAVQGKRRSLQP